MAAKLTAQLNDGVAQAEAKKIMADHEVEKAKNKYQADGELNIG